METKMSTRMKIDLTVDARSILPDNAIPFVPTLKFLLF